MTTIKSHPKRSIPAARQTKGKQGATPPSAYRPVAPRKSQPDPKSALQDRPIIRGTYSEISPKDIQSFAQKFLLASMADGRHFVRIDDQACLRENGGYSPVSGGALRSGLDNFFLEQVKTDPDLMNSLLRNYSTRFMLLAHAEVAVREFIPNVPEELVKLASPPPKALLGLLKATLSPEDQVIFQEAAGESKLGDSTKPMMIMYGQDYSAMRTLCQTMHLPEMYELSEEEMLTSMKDFSTYGRLHPVRIFGNIERNKLEWKDVERKFVGGIYNNMGDQSGVSYTKCIFLLDTLDGVSPDILKHADVIHVRPMPQSMKTGDIGKDLRGERLAIAEWMLAGWHRRQKRQRFAKNLLVVDYKKFPDSPAAVFLAEHYGIPYNLGNHQENIQVRIPEQLFMAAWHEWTRRNGAELCIVLPHLWAAGFDLFDVSAGKDEYGSKVYTNDPALIDQKALKLKIEGALEVYRKSQTYLCLA